MSKRRVQNLIELLVERLPQEVPVELDGVDGMDDCGEQQLASAHYLGFIAPVSDGKLARALLETLPTLTLYGATIDENDPLFGDTVKSEASISRGHYLDGFLNRITVLRGDVQMASMRLKGRSFDVIVLGEQCVQDMPVVKLMLRKTGLLVWQVRGTWWCQL